MGSKMNDRVWMLWLATAKNIQGGWLGQSEVINPNRCFNFGPTTPMERLGRMSENNTLDQIIRIVQCIWEEKKGMYQFLFDNKK